MSRRPPHAHSPSATSDRLVRAYGPRAARLVHGAGVTALAFGLLPTPETLHELARLWRFDEPGAAEPARD